MAKLEHHVHPNGSTLSTRFDPSKVVQISWRPRVFLYEGFLSDEECDHLISLANGKLEKIMVTNNDQGQIIPSGDHTYTGMFLSRGQDEVVSKIEERISTWTFLPKENGEDIQILHYGINESYPPHVDYYQDKSKLAYGGHRTATILMYLSNVTQGGETIFPLSELKDVQVKDETWSSCATKGYAVKPVKGSALLLFNLHSDATADQSSLHGGCAVLEGEKWSATKWFHVRTFNPRKPSSVPGDECTDEDDNCPHWAATGECQKNQVFMLGTPDYYGSCRKSCGVC